MKTLFTLVILGLGIIVISCSGDDDSLTGKSYINLRHTKNTALFTCKAPEGVAATFRANKDPITGEWLIQNYRKKEMRDLAQAYCEDKF